MSEYLIIGPSKAGKTALLATLEVAANDPELRDEGLRVRMTNPNENMRALSEQARSTIRGGQLPIDATDSVREYSFTLEIQRKLVHVLPFAGRRRTARFRMWDGPGGSLFPIPEERGPNFDKTQNDQFRAQLVEALKGADGFMLCLDASDTSRALVMFESFPNILHETGLSDLPAKRICICLTKADARFNDKGNGARSAVERTSARSHCEQELLPEMVFGTLSNYCTQATFGFGWTSAYGFLAHGEPNFDFASNRLRQWQLDDRGALTTINSWRPFRVLDPFIWIASGNRRDLEVVSADGLF